MNCEGSPKNQLHHHPSMMPDKRKTDGTEAGGLRTTPNLICSPALLPATAGEEHAPTNTPPVGGFYARREPLHPAGDLAGAGELDEAAVAGFVLGSVEEAICPPTTTITSMGSGPTSPPPSPTTAATGTAREYVFPPTMTTPQHPRVASAPRHRPSHSEDNASARINAGSSPTVPPSTSSRHGGGLRFRSHSISITDPVCRSAYESLVQSPAASFLAQFAQADDWKNRPSFEDGSRVDKYRVGRVLGRGSFSECREAESSADSPAAGGRVAMKIVKSSDGCNERGQNLEDFDRELVIWNRLRHRNILPLLDYIRLDNAIVAISPIADNGTLLDYLSKHGPFPEEEARGLFRQVCQAIAHMHTDQGIIHRDIKLDNILLDKTLRPYICDFGLSEAILDPGEASGGKGRKNKKRDEKMELLASFDEEDLSTSSASRARTEDDIYCKGSLWYLPPEELEPDLLLRETSDQALSPTSDPELRKKSDIWSLGIVLYALVTGRLPFTDDFLPRLQISVTTANYPPLPEQLSPALKDLQSRLLTVNVRERPSIDAVLQHPWLVVAD